MPTEILMPALSPTMEEGTLAKWHVKEGDEIAAGMVIAEIETDKATMEVEAVDEGTLGRILVSEGTEGVKVNTPIAVLLEEGESASDIEAGGKKASADAPAKAEKPAEKAASASEEKPATAKKTEEKPQSSAPPAPKSGGERIFASPLARRIAEQEGLDLARISGSGPHGRIVKADVEKAAKDGTGKAAPAPAAGAPAKAAAPAMSDDQIRAFFKDGTYEVVPHDNMRKVIARRLVEAKQTIPHFYLTVDCNIDALLAARAQVNASAPKDADGKPAWKISVNDFVIKALAVALQRVPDANVTWTEGGMLKHKGSDVGVAVSIPGGLITPVVRDAHAKGLAAISAEMKDYAARARDRKLKPEEYQGGTTAVSNLGMYGIKDFSAVINPPHATILAVGAGEQRPIVKDGKVEVATLMTVTLSTDHRAVDGALGAELLGAFKSIVENPLSLLL